MRTTERTTPAPESASPGDNFVHFYWETDGDVALELGVEVPTLCGSWMRPRQEHARVLKFPAAQADDCLECLAALRLSHLLGRKA